MDPEHTSGETPTPGQPLLRIVAGNPTDADVAVITALFASAGTASGERTHPGRARDQWGSPSDRLRRQGGFSPSCFVNREPWS
ncbi:acyl-CoA carboxylase subunit epsilon [Gordonia jinhuaensis]|uniref:Acyl-CoA carboxylase subunit epsilon n=1 Tax=Gordonia jinhuaensis TaxID=1517702 RepID=A0A916SU51_9ACTN|nr:acyl-CoA carboxylase subunit epsilon [Gordonia jinhuaensis]